MSMISEVDWTVKKDEDGYLRSFDVSQYLDRSAKIDLMGLDWESVRDYPVSDQEIRALTYMMDIESHTLCYLRDLLTAGAGSDPEIADFLGCWLYEEAYHGRAIERFLRVAGVQRPAEQCAARKPGLRERFDAFGANLVAKILPHFTTVHMTFGAVQEHSTLKGYTAMARKTKNPVLAELLRRIARQESRHFHFYYYKAAQGLRQWPVARRITSFFLRHFWLAVGESVKPSTETDFMIASIFDDPQGRADLRRIDETMARLPGLEWFNLMTKRAELAFARTGGNKQLLFV